MAQFIIDQSAKRLSVPCTLSNPTTGESMVHNIIIGTGPTVVTKDIASQLGLPLGEPHIVLDGFGEIHGNESTISISFGPDAEWNNIEVIILDVEYTMAKTGLHIMMEGNFKSEHDENGNLVVTLSK